MTHFFSHQTKYYMLVATRAVTKLLLMTDFSLKVVCIFFHQYGDQHIEKKIHMFHILYLIIDILEQRHIP